MFEYESLYILKCLAKRSYKKVEIHAVFYLRLRGSSDKDLR